VNNTRDWRLQCGGGGVDLRMGFSHGGRDMGIEMTDKRLLLFVGKMIGIHHLREVMTFLLQISRTHKICGDHKSGFVCDDPEKKIEES
jgi:hypothetical protein